MTNGNDFKYALSEGTVLNGPQRDYRVVAVLGQGGFGITYLVETSIKVGNIDVACRFAMKEHFISSLCERNAVTQQIVYSEPVAGEVDRSLKAFIREAERVKEFGSLHRNIVNVNELFEANGTAYYIMEYLEGDTLLEYVRKGGRLSYQATMEIMRPIIEAVAALHEQSIAHYDIKPANIILSRKPDGSIVPVLIDFGLSKHYDSEGEATSTLLQSGCSPGYSSVEQYVGLTTYTPQADVYSLAATIFFCLTGHAPKESFTDPAESIDEAIGDMVSPDVSKALRHAMAMKAASRTRNAAEFLGELSGRVQAVGVAVSDGSDTLRIDRYDTQRIHHSDTLRVPVGSTKKQSADLNKKRWKRYAIPGAIVLALIAGVLGFILTNGQQHEYEYVDLGLPSGTKWATMNVGASSPEDYGSFFSWAEIEPKEQYDSGVAFGENFGEIGGDKTKDAATANWGANWRMPSKTDFEEIMNLCDYNWTTRNGVPGLLFTSRANGNSIFLPAGGYKFFERWGLNGSAGRNLDYWSSTQKDGAEAYCLEQSEQNKLKPDLSGEHVNYGRLVRPVRKP